MVVVAVIVVVAFVAAARGVALGRRRIRRAGGALRPVAQPGHLLLHRREIGVRPRGGPSSMPAVAETATSATPGMRRTAVSILAAQPAQSMPVTR